MRADSVVVLDFETTGLSPDMGDRAIEIGAVKLEEGEVVDRFQALMNPGFRISSFIEGYTNISNDMLADAESCAVVMKRFADFMGDYNLVAHNASFDQKFLNEELRRVRRSYSGEFSCSVLLSRRINQDAYSHKLSELVDYLNLEYDGDDTVDSYHRALYDAEMTAQLWMAMLEDIGERYNVFDIPFTDIQKLTKTPKKSVDKLLKSWV